MLTNLSKKNVRFAKWYHWIGIVVASGLSIPLHFLYDWTGQLSVAGVFAPINESIWEHLKLVFLPLLLWWGIGYLVFKKKKNLSPSRWFTACAVSIFISMTFIVSWYYTLSGGFGIETSLTNLLSIFIAIPLGQLIAIHVYRAVQPRLVYFIGSVVFLVAFTGMFVWFTFDTPDFSIFIPPS